MKEERLLKIALSFSMLGLLALLVLTSGMRPEPVSTANLTRTADGQSVRVAGVVTAVEDHGKTLVITVAQPQEVDVVLFKDRNLTLAKGDYIETTGEVKQYMGNKELVATRLDLLS